MKKGKIIPYLIFVMFGMPFLWGCSDDNDDTDPGDEEFITLFPQIMHSPARISGTHFEKGDQIGVFVVPYEDEANTVPGDIGSSEYASNIGYRYNGTSWIPVSGTGIRWPVPRRNVDIYAYHPYIEGFGNPDRYSAPFTVQADQRTKAGYNNSDFLWTKASSIAQTKDPVELIFSHKLSKIRVNIRSSIPISDEEFQNAAVSILNAQNTTIINLSDGIIDPEEQSSTGEIYAYRHSSPASGYRFSAEAIIVPQTISRNIPFIRIDFIENGMRYHYVPNNDLSFESGKERTFNITINQAGISVATGDIIDWQPSDIIDGEIGKPLPRVLDLADIDWSQSLVHHIYDNGVWVGEVSREYIYKNGTVDYPAIVIYKSGAGEISDRTNALIARVFKRNRNTTTNEYEVNTASVHGGRVTFGTDNAISTYTAGTQPLINKIEITEGGISVAKDNAIPTLTIVPYVLTDVDNNSYSIVKIGTQYWMSENLKTEHFKDGSDLTYYYYNDNIANKNMYGGLYTWYIATDSRGLCPENWHVPLNNDWVTIYEYLRPDAGGKMKANILWSNLNNNNNVSGFSGLPGGRRTNTGNYSEILNYGQWWSTTSTGTNDAYRLYLDYGNVAMHNTTLNKSFTQSIRCLRDF